MTHVASTSIISLALVGLYRYLGVAVWMPALCVGLA